MEVSTKCVFTNTTQRRAYRGAGRPEGNYYMERLIDTAAAEMRHRPPGAAPRATSIRAEPDPVQDRRPALTYDSGDFAGDARRRRSKHSDCEGLRASASARASKRGKLRGLGIGSYLEVTAPPTRRWAASCFEADGGVTILHRHARLRPGPRHALRAGAERRSSACRSTRSASLQGDSDELPLAAAPGGSRVLMMTGARRSSRPPARS